MPLPEKPAWKDRVREDLAPFVDPGTQVAWTDSGSALVAEWYSYGTPLSATFMHSAARGFRVHFDGRQVDYGQFLSHPKLSDLLGLAKMIEQAYPSELYIDTKASYGQSGAAKPEPALELLHSALGKAESEFTRIIFVTAAAGAGKTFALRQLVRRQAASYLQGKTTRLFLYVNAQGRALAKLDEALAIELQDLRARLTYHAVAVLSRNGLLVPVIDGFDELMSPTGYDDPFSSLQRFVEQLRGQGQLVASARSAYYQREFVKRATDSVDESWALTPVEILDWTDAEFDSYLDARFASEAAKSAAVTKRVFLERARAAFRGHGNEDLRKKPFFVARAADLVLRGSSFNQAGGLVEHLVTSYLERDRTEKLLDPNRNPLLSAAQLRRLYASIAEEMWHQETRELDSRSLRAVAEIQIEDEVSAGALERVTRRLSASAFLRQGGNPNRSEFEHEIFLAYFLADAISPHLANVETLRGLLMRGTLPPWCANYAVVKHDLSGNGVRRIVASLCDAAKTELLRAEQIRENAGAIAVAALHHSHDGLSDPGVPLRLEGLMFAGQSFRDLTLRPVDVVDAGFRRCDFAGAKIDGTARNSWFQEIAIDVQTTELALSGVRVGDILGLRVREGADEQVLFSPDKVAAALARVGMKLVGIEASRSVAGEALDVMERLSRAFERTNVIWPGDEGLHGLAELALWRRVSALLIDAGVLRLEQRAQRGRAREALRSGYQASLIMAGLNKDAAVPEAIGRFWDQMERDFPGQRPRS